MFVDTEGVDLPLIRRTQRILARLHYASRGKSTTKYRSRKNATPPPSTPMADSFSYGNR